jgi:hypothetical protein
MGTASTHPEFPEFCRFTVNKIAAANLTTAT